MKNTFKTWRMALPAALGLVMATSVMAASAIQPRNGLWTSKLISHHMTDCPSMLASRVKAMVPGMMDKQGAERRTFKQPFHPRDLFGDSEKMHWAPAGLNRWHGVMKMGGQSQSGMSVDVVLDLHVLSTTHMEGSNTVTITMPPQLTAIMGGGSGVCESRVVAEMDWSKG